MEDGSNDLDCVNTATAHGKSNSDLGYQISFHFPSKRQVIQGTIKVGAGTQQKLL